MNTGRSSAQGFTLIELMITIAIIGILAGIAIPGYQNYMRKADGVRLVSYTSAFKNKAIMFYNTTGEWAATNDELGVGSEASHADTDLGVTRMQIRADDTNSGQVYLHVDLSNYGGSGMGWFRMNMEDTGAMIKVTCTEPGGAFPTHAVLAPFINC